MQINLGKAFFWALLVGFVIGVLSTTVFFLLIRKDNVKIQYVYVPFFLPSKEKKTSQEKNIGLDTLFMKNLISQVTQVLQDSLMRNLSYQEETISYICRIPVQKIERDSIYRDISSIARVSEPFDGNSIIVKVVKNPLLGEGLYLFSESVITIYNYFIDTTNCQALPLDDETLLIKSGQEAYLLKKTNVPTLLEKLSEKDIKRFQYAEKN